MKYLKYILVLVAGVVIGLYCTGCAKQKLEHRVGQIPTTIESR